MDFPDRKFQKIVPSEYYFTDGLYMFDVGQNDLDGAFYSKSDDQAAASIPTILSEFEAGIQVLPGLSFSSEHFPGKSELKFSFFFVDGFRYCTMKGRGTCGFMAWAL